MRKGRLSRIKSRATVGIAVIAAATLSIPLMPVTSGTLLNSVLTTAEVGGRQSSINPFARYRGSQSCYSDEALAALTVYLEAGGESFAGKLAVAAVIRNRMRLRYNSDGSVQGTVLKPWQFEPWNTRSPNHVALDLSRKSMRDSLLAWLLVQDGRNIVDGAVLFYNPTLVQSPHWAKVTRKVAAIGGHEFYAPRDRETYKSQGVTSLLGCIHTQTPGPPRQASAFPTDSTPPKI